MYGYIPNLHYGIPLNLEFNLITPLTSALKILPLLENKALTFYITSI